MHELFRRFVLLYGAQRCAGLYDAGEFDGTVDAWAEQLARVRPESIRAALDALPAQGRSWPPSLAEFVSLCRDATPRPEHRPALPVPKRTAEEIAAGAEQVAKIRAMLARSVKGVSA